MYSRSGLFFLCLFVAMLPCNGDRILVLKRNWLDLVLSGDKTMELRGKRLKSGRCFLGWHGHIYASADLGEATQIHSVEQFVRLQDQHCVREWEPSGLPYKRTFGLPLHNMQHVIPPIKYRHPKGAVGIVKYNAQS